MRACAIAFLAPLVLSCADAAAPFDGPVEVRVAFASAGTSIGAGQPLILDGNNGTLRVDSIFLLIGGVRVEVGGEDCDEPQASCVPVRDAVLLSLPLTFEPGAVGTVTLDGGASLTGIRFDVRTLRELDPVASAAITAARPAWPDSATALVTGTFRRDGDAPIPFRTWLRASFEARADLAPPQTATEGLTLVLIADPVGWFSRPKGEVLELSYFDHATTGRVLAFTSVLRNGFGDLAVPLADR